MSRRKFATTMSTAAVTSLIMAVSGVSNAIPTSSTDQAEYPRQLPAENARQAIESTPNDEELQDLRRLAEDTGKTYEEVYRKHSNASQRSAFLTKVSTSFAEKYSGARVAPDGALEIYFKGASSPAIDSAISSSPQQVPVKAGFNRSFSENEWSDEVSLRFAATLRGAGVSRSISRYDAANDQVRIQVAAKDLKAANSALAANQRRGGPVLLVEANDTAVKVTPETTVLGGSNLGV